MYLALLNDWLSRIDDLVNRKVQTTLDNVHDCIDEFEKIKKDELPIMEQNYRGASQAAQNLCRSGYGKGPIQRMLHEMTDIKNRFVSSREKIEKYLTAWSSLSEPLTELGQLYEGIQSWCEESEEIIEGYEDPTCKVDDINK